jgi:phosphohistidine phosphatase
VKSLLLLRHAKSDWDSGPGGDHDRPLSGRGRKAAARMGRFLAAAELVPDLCLTSSAVRAADTLARAARHGGWEHVPREERRSLYGAGPADVVGLLSSLPDEIHRILLVGHEPGWSETVRLLTGGSSVRMATGTLARIDFEVDRWVDCRAGGGRLSALVTPRMVEALRPPRGSG